MRGESGASARTCANWYAPSPVCGLYSIGSPRSFTNGTLYSRRIAVIAP
jgi:hypothetical protein